MRELKEFDVTIRHNLKVKNNGFGEKIKNSTATFTRTIVAVTKERAVEKMKEYCKERGTKIVKIFEPLERP